MNQYELTRLQNLRDELHDLIQDAKACKVKIHTARNDLERAHYQQLMTLKRDIQGCIKGAIRLQQELLSKIKED